MARDAKQPWSNEKLGPQTLWNCSGTALEPLWNRSGRSSWSNFVKFSIGGRHRVGLLSKRTGTAPECLGSFHTSINWIYCSDCATEYLHDSCSETALELL